MLSSLDRKINMKMNGCILGFFFIGMKWEKLNFVVVY